MWKRQRGRTGEGERGRGEGERGRGKGGRGKQGGEGKERNKVLGR